MRAPICRTCGIAHWGSVHVYPRTKAPSQADLSVGLPDRPSLAPRESPSQKADQGKMRVSVPPTGAMASDVGVPKFLRRSVNRPSINAKVRRSKPSPPIDGADLPGRLTASKPMMGSDLSDAALRPGVQTDAGDRATQPTDIGIPITPTAAVSAQVEQLDQVEPTKTEVYDAVGQLPTDTGKDKPTVSLFTEEDEATITEASGSDTVSDDPTDVLTSTGKTDRKKYLREYMRQYRAGVKAAKAKAATEGMA